METTTVRIKQAASALGLSITTLKRLEKRGLIKAGRDFSNQRRYGLTAIEQLRERMLRGELTATGDESRAG